MLVVDDEPAVAAALRESLTAETHSEPLAALRVSLFGDTPPSSPLISFEVSVALQGEQARVLAKEALQQGRPFQLAFVDMRMPPGWNGIETVASLWKVDPRLFSVIHTAYSDFRWDDVLTKLGRSDGLHLLRKPLRASQIRRTAEVLTTKWLRKNAPNGGSVSR